MTLKSRTVVAVDVGTSAVRAALADLDKGVQRSCNIARTQSTGGTTFDADQLYEDVIAALRGLETRERPAALSISAHIGAVAIDQSLRPVAEAAGWANIRGQERLSVLDEASLTAAGRPCATGGALAFAAELATQPIARDVFAVVSPKDFLLARLTGQVRTDAVDAAYTLGFDVRSGTWIDAAIRALDVPASWMPKVNTATEVMGELGAQSAGRAGLPAGVPVVAGGPDGSVGVGLLLGERDDLLADIAGTTDVLGRLLRTPDAAPPGAVINPALLPARWVAGGATGMTGGAVARWRALGGPVDESELAEIETGSGGLRIIPTMSGARFPHWRPGIRGAVLGQRPEHGAAHLLHASQEASAFVVKEGLDLLNPTGELPVTMAGGAMRSAHVAQLRADVLQRTLLVASDPDVTLLGAAALAALGVGLVDGLEEARDLLNVSFKAIEPRDSVATAYAAAYDSWLQAMERIINLA